MTVAPVIAASRLELLRPELAGLVLLAPLLLLISWRVRSGLDRRLREAFAPERLASFVRERDAGRAATRVLCAAGAIACAALALLGPVLGELERRVVARGLDLVVCLDTSRSMLSRDLKPSRFERAQREVVDLLEAARGDRIALLAFSGDVRRVAPLTRDTGVLAGLVEGVAVSDNRLGGTDLGAALEQALELFDGRSGAHEAVVLVTDGEDLEGRGAELAREAGRRGIRVFVVGIGTEAGGKIPVASEPGQESFLRGPDGEEVVTRLDGRGLAALAEASGGAYRSTEQAPRPLVELYEKRIARLDARDLEGGLERVPIERFQWPLALGVLLILLQTALTERRRVR